MNNGVGASFIAGTSGQVHFGEVSARKFDKARNIAERALKSANQIICGRHELSKQTAVVHHYYHEPLWWWYPYPSYGFYNGFGSCAPSYSSDNRKDDDKVSSLVLIIGLGMAAAGFYYTVKEMADLWLLQAADNKIQKNRTWIATEVCHLPENSKALEALKKLDRVVKKEEDIVRRIHRYTRFSFLGKAGFMVSGAIGIGAWAAACQPALWAFGAGTAISTAILLYKWGTSGYVDAQNLKDADKIYRRVEDFEKSIS